jgi:ankyrin repeat protein
VFRDKKRECWLDVEKTVTASQVKEMAKEQWEIDPLEQLMMFGGVIYNGEEQPLAKHVEKEGEKLEFWIVEQPLRYKQFCKAEKFKKIGDKNKYGCTILHRACIKAEISVVEEVLAKKNFKEVNATDNNKMTALHRAMLCQFSEICLILLECPRFTALNQSDHEKRTVLHLAAIWGNADICNAIIARSEFKSTSHTKRDVFGRTALDYAEEWGNDEAAEILRAAMPELPPEDENATADSRRGSEKFEPAAEADSQEAIQKTLSTEEDAEPEDPANVDADDDE